MKKRTMQCDALTIASTYSASHRCLKRNGVQKVGAARLCAHHRASNTTRVQA